MHGVRLCAPAGAVKRQFIGGNDHGVVVPRDIQGIAEMVAVTVAYKNKIGMQFIGSDFRDGIVRKIGIE